VSLEENSEPSGGRVITVKRFLLFVVMPSLIAGFFSLAPKLYDELTKPVTRLIYSVTAGPALSSSGQSRRIYSVDVSNAGKTSVTAVEMQIELPGGTIESVAAEKSVLKPSSVLGQPGEARIAVPKMLPGERLRLALMTNASNPAPSLKIDLRSSEVLGTADDSRSEKTDTGTVALVGAALSAFSVATMSIAFFAMVRSRRLSRVLLPTEVRSDWVTLIAGLSAVEVIKERVCFTDHDMSYARLADLFLIVGRSADEDTRKRCVMGLLAILLCARMNRNSAEKARENLSYLGETMSDEDFEAKLTNASKMTPLQQRRAIATLLLL
jgi:hypothetical protein